MSVHLYEMSSRLLGDTVGKVNENLTSVFLAASLITLLLGYVSKLRLSHACDKDAVSEKKKKIKQEIFSPYRLFTDLFLSLQKYPPYIPSSIPFLGHAIAFGKSPIEFLENAYKKVSLKRFLRILCLKIDIFTLWYNYIICLYVCRNWVYKSFVFIFIKAYI